MIYQLAIFILTVSFYVSSSANCVTDSTKGYVSNIKRTRINLYAHKHENQLAVHVCNNHSCSVIVKGSKSQLCENEKSTGRVKVAFRGIVRGLASGGADTATAALGQVVKQLRLDPECPATEILDRAADSQSIQKELVTYFEVAGQYDLVPNFRKLENIENYDEERIQDAINFFSQRAPYDYTADGNLATIPSPFFPDMTTSTDETIISQYCAIF